MIELSNALDEWAEGWSNHDMERVASVFTDDCIYEDVALGVVNRGKDQLKAFGNGFIAGVPDLKVEVTSRFASGDKAAAEWTMSGTHTGDLPGMPATGKTFSLRGASAFQLQGNRVIRCSDYWDLATFQKQLGFTS
jgi:steroid delta-isomerase-like uncharacterized protein